MAEQLHARACRRGMQEARAHRRGLQPAPAYGRDMGGGKLIAQLDASALVSLAGPPWGGLRLAFMR